MIGKTIGNYTIVDQLGAGGMGEVYRARDTRLDRDVAIKVLPEAFASDAERLARFEREAKVLAGMSHPNIGAIFGVEEADGNTFLVLELVEGEDLSQRIARGPIPVDEAMDIARQVAEALEAAHEQGVIHRDLKPANIVVSQDGRARVLDFGLAKALDADAATSSPNLSNSPTALASSPTMAGVILGTAAYMSPEQARGKTVDKRADVFAFGAVLWEMLTGRQLFSGGTVSDTLAAVLRAEPDHATLPNDTPPALRALLRRCLEKDATQRLRDIGEARIALDDIRAGNTGEAAPPGQRGLLARIVPYTGWVATAILVVVVMVLQSRSGPVQTTGEPTRELPLRKFSIELSADDPSIATGFEPEISPNGRFLAYVSNNQIWLRDLESPDAYPVPGTEGGHRPFWSPDSRTIAFGVGSKVMRIPMQGGRASVVGTFSGGMMMGTGSGVWNEDDRLIVTTSQGGLFEVPAHGGDITVLLNPTGTETDFHEIGRLPAGRGWVFVIHDQKGIGNIDVLTADGERIEVLRIEDSVVKPKWSPSGHIVFRRTGTNAGVWAVPFSLERMETTGEPFLVAAGGRFPSVSQDGTLVYSRGIQSGRGQLTWVDRTGAELGTVGAPMETARPFPSLSDDDRYIVIAENFGDTRELFLYDTRSNNRRRLTFNDLRVDVARFHPNGTDIVYYDSGTYSTHIQSLNGSGDPRSILNMVMPEVTPDGKYLLGARKLENRFAWEIHWMPFDGDGSESTRIVGAGGVDWWPAISPDGRYLAYVSDETGRDEVYITTFPDPTTRWQVSTNGGNWPRWRSDGEEIFYTALGRIMAVEIDAGAGLTLGTPQVLFRTSSTNWSTRWPDAFDVTADGERFILVNPIQAAADVPPSIVVVQNWYAEFAR